MERYVYHFQPSCLVYILWHSVEVEELNFSLEELPSFSSILSQKVFVKHLLQYFFHKYEEIQEDNVQLLKKISLSSCCLLPTSHGWYIFQCIRY